VHLSRPSTTPSSTTPRQHEVLDLVARGLSNKEIAHEMGITERGAAAHVSRLLVRYGATNRAMLVAQVLAEQVGQPGGFAELSLSLDEREILASVREELAAYEDSVFLVSVTLGPDQIVAYQNRRNRELTGPIELGRKSEDLFTSPSHGLWRARGHEAFVTGRPVVASSAPSSFSRPDGTSFAGTFACVLQPFRDQHGVVRGVLWICSDSSETAG
jgi:DNA-binding CsgD family transcriptional regulator